MVSSSVKSCGNYWLCNYPVLKPFSCNYRTDKIWGLLPKFSPEVRADAAKYCKEQGDFSEFYEIIRTSRVGTEEFAFRGVNYTSHQNIKTKKEQTPQSGSGSKLA